MKFIDKQDQVLLETKHGVLVGELSFVKNNNQIDIVDLYVYPGFRDNKFGEKMIEHLVKTNKEHIVTSEKWYAKAIISKND